MDIEPNNLFIDNGDHYSNDDNIPHFHLLGTNVIIFFQRFLVSSIWLDLLTSSCLLEGLLLLN